MKVTPERKFTSNTGVKCSNQSSVMRVNTKFCTRVTNKYSQQNMQRTEKAQDLSNKLFRTLKSTMKGDLLRTLKSTLKGDLFRMLKSTLKGDLFRTLKSILKGEECEALIQKRKNIFGKTLPQQINLRLYFFDPVWLPPSRLSSSLLLSSSCCLSIFFYPTKTQSVESASLSFSHFLSSIGEYIFQVLFFTTVRLVNMDHFREMAEATCLSS